MSPNLLVHCDTMISMKCITLCRYRYSTGAGGFDVVTTDSDSAAAPIIPKAAVVSSTPVKAGGGASSAVSAWASGMAVELSSAHAKHGDAASGPLKPGQCATIVVSDGIRQAVLVRTAAGREVGDVLSLFVHCEFATM